MKKLVKGLKFRAMFSYDLYASGFTKGDAGLQPLRFLPGQEPRRGVLRTWDHTDVAFDGIHADTEGLSFPERRPRTELLLQV